MLNYPEFSDVMRAKEFLILWMLRMFWGKILIMFINNGNYIKVTIGEKDKL